MAVIGSCNGSRIELDVLVIHNASCWTHSQCVSELNCGHIDCFRTGIQVVDALMRITLLQAILGMPITKRNFS